MNWTRYEVSDAALKNLLDYNEPIPVQGGLLTPNSGVEVYSLSGHQVNAIYDARLGAIRKLNKSNPQFDDMKNRDLLLYNDHLLSDGVNTIIVDGFFGTGKTSTVCSHLVDGLLREKNGQRGIPVAYISKPHEGVGKSYGFLPGSLHEKTEKEFQSYTQYFNRFGQPGLADYLMMRDSDQQNWVAKEKALSQPMLHLLVFEYLRGLDIEEGWIVLDEAQNTDRKEISTFVSRVGDKAKMIVIGDSTPTQIDKKGNTPHNNGLQFMKDTYIGRRYTGYVELQSVSHIIRGQRVRDLYLALKGGK